ncbi:hypothetical protein ACFE04_026209 [Oxalis oulophora]
MRGLSEWRRFVIFIPLLLFLPYLFSVMELSNKQQEQQKFNNNNNNNNNKKLKLDHLLLGHPAGQGISNRLQCQGTKALNKTTTRASSSLHSKDSVIFVTVFTIYNTSLDTTSNSVTVGNKSYTKIERSMAVLNIFINFIQATMPRSSVNILTDPASTLSVNRDGVTVIPIQGEYSRDNLMLQRIRSYIIFLETKYEEHSQEREHMTHYIFTDSDMAVVDDLTQIFHDHPNFHLALTFRNNKGQPLNSGFIAVRGTKEGILRGKIFLEQVFEAYSSKYMSASRMLGDQLAMASVIKSHPSFDERRFAKPQPFLENIGGASVLFLPCLTYNWTPPEGAGQFHGMPLDVKVVHFKGSRKRLMLESWNFFQSSLDISDMLCLILASGRTKYDF